ncbi:hypothetical protein ACMFMG_004216 [Clarireedia jacksonii]
MWPINSLKHIPELGKMSRSGTSLSPDANCQRISATQENENREGRHISFGGLHISILMLHDNFGYTSLNLSAADTLTHINVGYRVVVLGLLTLESAIVMVDRHKSPVSPRHDEAHSETGDTPMASMLSLQKLVGVVEALNAEFRYTRSWSLLGLGRSATASPAHFLILCIALQASTLRDMPFHAVAIAHPLGIEMSVDDNDSSCIPVMIVISQSEDNASLRNLRQAVQIKILEDVRVGFLASGANLNNDTQRQAWDRGWETVGKFFGG